MLQVHPLDFDISKVSFGKLLTPNDNTKPSYLPIYYNGSASWVLENPNCPKDKSQSISMDKLVRNNPFGWDCFTMGNEMAGPANTFKIDEIVQTTRDGNPKGTPESDAYANAIENIIKLCKERLRDHIIETKVLPKCKTEEKAFEKAEELIDNNMPLKKATQRIKDSKDPKAREEIPGQYRMSVKITRPMAGDTRNKSTRITMASINTEGEIMKGEFDTVISTEDTTHHNKGEFKGCAFQVGLMPILWFDGRMSKAGVKFNAKHLRFIPNLINSTNAVINTMDFGAGAEGVREELTLSETLAAAKIEVEKSDEQANEDSNDEDEDAVSNVTEDSDHASDE
jgi:hypothetical protein